MILRRRALSVDWRGVPVIAYRLLDDDAACAGSATKNPVGKTVGEEGGAATGGAVQSKPEIARAERGRRDDVGTARPAGGESSSTQPRAIYRR